jgi:hypothetical protein
VIGTYVLFRMTGKVAGKDTYRLIVAVPRQGPNISLHGEAVSIADAWQQETHPNMPRARWDAYPRPHMGDPRETIYGRVDI